MFSSFKAFSATIHRFGVILLMKSSNYFEPRPFFAVAVESFWKKFRLLIGCCALRSVLAALILLSADAGWCADYKDDVGYARLAQAMGTAVPDGQGVTATQVEAAVTVEGETHWMPDSGDTQFTGKTIIDATGGDDGSSGHATGVGRYFYGNTLSTAGGIGTIHVYEANDWIGLGFLGTGYLYGGRPFQPVYDRSTMPWTLSAPGRVANHSWVGTAGGAEGDILRRLDFVASRDEYIQVTALNNGTTRKPLLGDAFNSITVGRTDGSHPMGTSDIDELYVAGRVSPLVVAPFSVTSTCAPVVSAAVALLIEAGRDPVLSTDPVAATTTNRSGEVIHNTERAEVIKAVILAGAQRVTHNTWLSAQIMDYRQDGANGLDRRFGAGQLDVYNSYQMIAAGEQNSGEDRPETGGIISAYGFDFDPAFGGASGCNTTGTYTFTPAAGQRRLWASLVWNLRIDGGSAYDYDDTAMLYDLNLALYDITATGYQRLVAASYSSVDNSENLWAELVPGRTYKMVVTTAGEQSAFSWDYALAWRMDTPTDSDGDGIPDDWEVQNGLNYTLADDAGLDPDSDQLSNLQEFQYGTDPSCADSDADGQPDGEEIRNGADPLNPLDAAVIPSVPAMTPPGLCLCFLGLGVFGMVKMVRGVS